MGKSRLWAAILGLSLAAGAGQAQMAAHQGDAHMHGADGTGHDEVNMPGLRGLDATPEESAELAVMFAISGPFPAALKTCPTAFVR